MWFVFLYEKECFEETEEIKMTLAHIIEKFKLYGNLIGEGRKGNLSLSTYVTFESLEEKKLK